MPKKVSLRNLAGSLKSLIVEVTETQMEIFSWHIIDNGLKNFKK